MGERAYRALMLLYPRAFRRDYGDQMLQLYRDERRDRTTSWARLTGDIVASAPVQYKETFRTMSTQGKLVTSALVLVVAIAAFLAVGGAVFALVLLALLASILARLLRERNAQLSNGYWWKLTVSGIGVFAVATLFFGGPWPQSWRDEVPGEVAWWSGMFVFATALVMIVAGLLSGAVQLASRRRLSH
jgi:hypothetical protein